MIPEPAGGPTGRRWLSVWPTGQHDLAHQLTAGGYLPATTADTAAIPPAVAAHAIAAYTRPGDTVYDPDCGAGTVCVEALRAGRHAVGLTGDPGWWDLARGNLTAAKTRGAPGDGMVLDQSPSARSWTGLVRPVDLVLTTIRPPGPGHGTACPSGDGPDFSKGGPDRAGSDQVRAALSGLPAVTRPGGRLVVVLPPDLRGAGRVDLASLVLDAGRGIGLVPVERCVALTTALRGATVAIPPARPAG
ncbi:DNA methyltransferase, partial [Protofrankia coriariae]